MTARMAGARSSHQRRMTWLWRAVAVAFIAITVFPVYWMVNSSFEPNGQITSLTPSFFPVHFTFQNFVSAVNRPYFWTDARNSLIVVVSAVILVLVVAFLAATAVTRFQLRGARSFLVLILVVQMVPTTALVIPMFLILDKAKLIDSFPGLILTYVALTLPFTIWMLRGFVRGIPIDLEEAALVDGCNRLGAFRRILFPLVLPGLISTGVFAFITAWNDFLFANVIMQQQYRQTLPVWLFGFVTNTGIDYGGLMASCTLFALPVVIFFMIVQRRMISGLTAGAVKG
ncbi:MAG TPA: carbohydrate ABC transporter permease [Acidimicrobiales bacterium]|nr:carbohydrate ABC transporter permease [Acidimicrobiales bacterium]